MSREAPPPTERIASAPAERYAAIPFSASESVGLGAKSLKTVNGIPDCSSCGDTNRSSPAFKIPWPVTSNSWRAPARFSSPGSSRIAPRPWTIRVGKDMIEGICKAPSDDFEVSLQLPLRHRRFELAALPLPGPHVVIDEPVA